MPVWNSSSDPLPCSSPSSSPIFSPTSSPAQSSRVCLRDDRGNGIEYGWKKKGGCGSCHCCQRLQINPFAGMAACPTELFDEADASTCPAPDPCPSGQGFSSGACLACTGKTFSSTTSTDGCNTHKTCGPGEGVAVAGTASADTVCEACNSGTKPNSYSPYDSQLPCQDHQTCPKGSGKGESH